MQMSLRRLSEGPPAPLSSARTRALDAAALALVCTAVALPYFNSELSQDAVRDLMAAEKIATGKHYPLVGPTFNQGAFALGPVWFYVLAVPSVLGASFSGSAFFVGILASLKLPLCFLWGKLVADRRFGWSLVAAACWPATQAFQWLWWSTPNAIETCLWGTAVCATLAYRNEDSRGGWWLGAASLLGLAVHAHATALLYAPILGIAWLVWAARLPADHRTWYATRNALGALVSFSVWFAPSAVQLLASSSGADGVSAMDLEGIAARAGRVGVVGSRMLWNYPVAAWQSWVSGPEFQRLIEALVLCWYAAVTLGFCLALRRAAGAGHERRDVSRWILGMAATALVGLVVLTSLRRWVPFYTTYCVLPALTVVQGGALWLLWSQGGPWLRALGSTLVTTGLIATLVLAAGAYRENAVGVSDLRIANLGNLVSRAGDRGGTMRVRQSPRASQVFSEWLCDNEVAVVHGTVAFSLGSEQMISFDRHCDDAARPVLIGSAFDHHVVGFPLQWFETASKEPVVSSDGIGAAWARQVVHPSRGHRVGPEFTYFQQAPDRRPEPVPLVVRFSTSGDEVVAITNLKPWAGRLEVLGATQNGSEANPAQETALGTLWLADPDTAGPITWVFRLRTDVPRWIDIVTF